jgi:hypothetical protein
MMGPPKVPDTVANVAAPRSCRKVLVSDSG